jgi:phosphatidylserine decarboxylase
MASGKTTRMKHQYIERQTGKIRTEEPYGDRIVNMLYSRFREKPPGLFRALTGPRMSSLLGFINYDSLLAGKIRRCNSLLDSRRIDFRECLDNPLQFKSPRDLFERRIRYWECRPMPADPCSVVSPADSRMLAGSLSDTSRLFLKDKFFEYEELLGADKNQWLGAFDGGDFAVFRLTPEKYHYNHSPVTGKVEDIYALPGGYHSCNPGAVVAEAAPHSKNKRVITIMDTDVPRGTGVGLVAMVEVAALMIGDIAQCYSPQRYDDPRPVAPGMLLLKGAPKSMYRPGSSTDVLLFQRGRIRFADDLLRNLYRVDVESRFSVGFGRPLVETDVKVRSLIAMPQPNRLTQRRRGAEKTKS